MNNFSYNFRTFHFYFLDSLSNGNCRAVVAVICVNVAEAISFTKLQAENDERLTHQPIPIYFCLTRGFYVKHFLFYGSWQFFFLGQSCSNVIYLVENLFLFLSTRCRMITITLTFCIIFIFFAYLYICITTFYCINSSFFVCTKRTLLYKLVQPNLLHFIYSFKNIPPSPLEFVTMPSS